MSQPISLCQPNNENHQIYFFYHREFADIDLLNQFKKNLKIKYRDLCQDREMNLLSISIQDYRQTDKRFQISLKIIFTYTEDNFNCLEKQINLTNILDELCKKKHSEKPQLLSKTKSKPFFIKVVKNKNFITLLPFIGFIFLGMIYFANNTINSLPKPSSESQSEQQNNQ